MRISTQRAGFSRNSAGDAKLAKIVDSHSQPLDVMDAALAVMVSDLHLAQGADLSEVELAPDECAVLVVLQRADDMRNFHNVSMEKQVRGQSVLLPIAHSIPLRNAHLDS